MNLPELFFNARYGEDEELNQYLLSREKDLIQKEINAADASQTTALHMACANGHLECVKLLIKYGAKHLANASGNFPLHWAVQNKHKEVVKELLDKYPDMDVLAQNSFGRGSLTEAFQAGDTDIVALLLEHPSASEQRLCEGTGVNPEDNEDGDEEHVEEEEETKLEDIKPKVLQEATFSFAFDNDSPQIQVRELALDWNKDVFGVSADEDSTGVSIWSASLILARWVRDMRAQFAGKSVCELGSGCGLSGIAAHQYTNASRVVLTDLFDHTLDNLRHNVKLNESSVLDDCSACGATQRCTSDNPSGKLLLCGGCRQTQYCSRECQKKAWKSGHKAKCPELKANPRQEKQPVQVMALDWAQVDSFPAATNFDMLIGSDLVYHKDIVPILVNTIDSLLTPQGQFYHVASQERDSLPEFKEAMESRGFKCTVQLVPDSYKANPLVGEAAELFDLHFNEMSNTYCMYTFHK